MVVNLFLIFKEDVPEQATARGEGYDVALGLDIYHSKEEDRFILLGCSSHLRILVVIHCYREEDAVIRIISARKANRNEQRQYEGFM